jgi:hypothetical protein
MMHIIEIDGEELNSLLATLRSKKISPHKLRVTLDGDTVKFKVNEYMWSPPMGHRDPTCEVALRRAAHKKPRKPEHTGLTCCPNTPNLRLGAGVAVDITTVR